MTSNIKNLFVLAVVLLPTTMSAHADVALNGLFTDHMVLQREIPVSIFGVAEPGEKVTVAFSPQQGSGQAGQEKSAAAAEDGTWSVKLDAMKASTNPAVMTVTGNNKIEVKDIVIGDVWVCSGQSNMEWTLGNCNRPDDVKNANVPLLRQFLVPAKVSSHPATETRSGWAVCTPQSAGQFTAVGFYFGRKIHQETGIPIGLIKTAWGGTQVEPWCTPHGLASVPELAKDREKLDKQIKEYREKFKANLPRIEAYVAESRSALANDTDLPPPVELPHPISSREPTGWHCLYNGMINPLVRYGIKGALWYQGENNGNEGDSYFQKKRALIGGWRKAWDIGDFPFYFVQLCSFSGYPGTKPNESPVGGEGWAALRMAQLKTLAIPKTGMAVSIDLADIGNHGNIHPTNKKDVGERLALWSLAKDYGKKDLVSSGPLYKAMKIEEGKIRITFDSVGSGLTAATKKGYDPMVKDPSGLLKKFAIAGEDTKWVWADAVIEGATVVVSSPSVPKPVAVRYAFSWDPDGCNLYNLEGLPASPFRTDEW